MEVKSMGDIIDVLNQFILEYNSELTGFDITQFQNATSQLVSEKMMMPSPTIVSPSMYCDYIDKVVSNLNTLSIDVDTLDSFFSKVYKSASLNDKDISIYLQPYEDIDKIRPEYLNTFPAEMEVAVKKIISGDFKENDIRRRYTTGEFYEKLKKQLVKTTVPHNDVKDLMVFDKPRVVRIDNIYIQNNLLPFVRSYKQNTKELINIAYNTKGRINSSYSDLMVTMNTIRSMQESNKLDPNTTRILTYFSYNIMRQYMNLCAYIVGMIIRKAKYYGYNIMSYTNLYNRFYSFFPEGELILHEYVDGDDIRDIDDSTLLSSMLNNGLNVAIPHIDSAINKKKMQIANIVSKKFNYKLNYTQDIDVTKYPYDTYPYASVNKSFIDIINNLHTFEVNMKDANMIVDDVLAKSNLDDTFMSRYSSILSSLSNVEYYTSQLGTGINNDGSVNMAIFSDLSRFKKNLIIISNNASKANRYFESLKSSMESNIHNLDDNSFNEYRDALENAHKNFKEYTLNVVKALLDRLDNLADLLDDNDILPDSSEPEEFVPYDYDLESYQGILEEQEIFKESVFESLLSQYHKIRLRKDTGIILEEVGEAEDGKKAPSVQSDAQTQHDNNKTNTTTNTNTNNQEATKKSIVESFKKWISDILDKFRNKSKGLAERNNRWLQSVKSQLENLDTSNTTINIAKYENVTTDKILADISSASNKIDTINASNLPADLKTATGAERYLFPSIPAKVGNENSFVGKIRQYLTFGNTPKTNLTSYKGDDAKAKITNMISFCEQYGEMYTKVSTELDKLSESAAKKQQDIINTLGTQSQSTTTTKNDNNSNQGSNVVTASAHDNISGLHIFEADASANGEDNKEKMSSSSIITSTVRKYVGAILTIIEKKYLDYIKVLSKLAPKNTKEEPAKAPEKEGENVNASTEDTIDGSVMNESVENVPTRTPEEYEAIINESLDDISLGDLY